MNAFWIGQLIGYLLFSIVIPAVLLLVFNLTPLKRRPAIAYGICAVFAVVVPLLALRGRHELIVQPIIASCLGALLFFSDYRREIKKQLTST
jgi:hypothetical protein